jgi:hypothetical protein
LNSTSIALQHGLCDIRTESRIALIGCQRLLLSNKGSIKASHGLANSGILCLRIDLGQYLIRLDQITLNHGKRD